AEATNTSSYPVHANAATARAADTADAPAANAVDPDPDTTSATARAHAPDTSAVPTDAAGTAAPAATAHTATTTAVPTDATEADGAAATEVASATGTSAVASGPAAVSGAVRGGVRRKGRWFSLLRRGRRADPGGAAEPGAGEPLAAESVAAVAGLAVRRGRVQALRRVDLGVTSGETIALMGRNGAGKSTLLSALVGLVEPAAGSVRVGGAVPHRIGPRELIRRVGLVPQEPRDLLHADTVAGECAAADRDADAAPGSCRALVSELLPGIADDTHPRDLSEGQRLTLALAVVLTARPPLLLLDEPTRGLDYAAKARVVTVLRGLAAEGHSIVLATHDVELAAELAHRVVILAEGEVVADGPTPDVVVSSPAFAPQVTKILAPQHWLTVTQVRTALAGAR
ncbi:ATP-binding cassette domain-containing protein, partial [Streptomyces sp. E11-3]|uniref:ATP-binding cassette domain-containing protein n=1 Tax=Streptomyces sp. E11-3 TaxID=3110112 RepID=UPI00398087E9